MAPTEELMELFNYINDELIERGFTFYLNSNLPEDYKYTRSVYYFPEYCKGFPSYEGTTLEVSKIPHSNGAKNDASYRIDVVYWKNSSGKTLDKVKVSTWDTLRNAKAKIITIIESYKNFCKNGLQI